MAGPPVISKQANVGVLLVLVALALLTWRISYLDLGRWNLIAAMAIAVLKALLVVLVFMHAWFSLRVAKLAFFAGFFWLAILIVLTLTDYLSRSWLP